MSIASIIVYSLLAGLIVAAGIIGTKWEKEEQEREKEKLSKMSPEARELYIARKKLAAERAALEYAKKEAEWERERRYSEAAAAYTRADNFPEGPYRDKAKAEAMARMIANAK